MQLEFMHNTLQPMLRDTDPSSSRSAHAVQKGGILDITRLHGPDHTCAIRDCGRDMLSAHLDNSNSRHAAGCSPIYQFKNSDITLNHLCALHRRLSSTENNSWSLHSWASLLLVIVISVFRQRELDGLLPAYLDP
jgi:hypothetical protein